MSINNKEDLDGKWCLFEDKVAFQLYLNTCKLYGITLTDDQDKLNRINLREKQDYQAKLRREYLAGCIIRNERIAYLFYGRSSTIKEESYFFYSGLSEVDVRDSDGGYVRYVLEA